MDKSKMVLTKRIQLLVDCEDKEQKHAYYQKLYAWQRICYQAANIACSHLFIQDRISEFFYLTNEAHRKLADNSKDGDGMLKTSRMNTVYSVLSQKFKGNIPMHIISTLNMSLTKYYNNEKKDYYLGEKSLRNYKKDIPIPFQPVDIRQFRNCERRQEYQFNWFQIPFRTYLGREKGDKRLCLQTFLVNKSILKTSSLQIKDGKLYLLAVFEHQLPPVNLDASVIAEAELSFEVPIILTVDQRSVEIGSKEDFFYKRMAIQAAIRRKQKAASYNRPQHGRQRLLKAIDQFKAKERNFVNHTLHLYSARLIEACKKHNVGTLILRRIAESPEQGEALETDYQNKLIIRNWSYFSLTDKIKYKAHKSGIELIAE
jgi:IS605 OrfB family transposase